MVQHAGGVNLAPICNRSVRMALSNREFRVKGTWRYLYRTVDSTGAILDFLLSAKQDAAAAKRLLAKALGRINHPTPRVINTDMPRIAPAELAAAGFAADPLGDVAFESRLVALPMPRWRMPRSNGSTVISDILYFPCGRSPSHAFCLRKPLVASGGVSLPELRLASI